MPDLDKFFVFTACSGSNIEKQASNKEKYEAFLASLEGNNATSNVAVPKRDLSPLADIDLYAVVREDNVRIYSRPDPNSEIIGYLYSGDVVNFTVKTRNQIEAEDGLGYFYLLHEYDVSIFLESGKKESTGWVFRTNIEFLKLEKIAETIISNSEKVSTTGFPVQLGHPSEYTGTISLPYYLDDTNEWAVFDNTLSCFGIPRLTVHLADLPQYFDFIMVNNDENQYIKFPAERDSALVIIEDYYEYLDDEQKAVLERINPIYSFKVPVLLSPVPMDYKLEIRAKNNNVLYSTYITYPAMPFMIQSIKDGSYFLRYITESPVYLAIYETHMPSLERTPACAFLITPNDGIWEGIVSLGSEFKKDSEYRVCLYTFDETNPADYSKLELIKGYWDNTIDF